MQRKKTKKAIELHTKFYWQTRTNVLKRLAIKTRFWDCWVRISYLLKFKCIVLKKKLHIAQITEEIKILNLGIETINSKSSIDTRPQQQTSRAFGNYIFVIKKSLICQKFVKWNAIKLSKSYHKSK